MNRYNPHRPESLRRLAKIAELASQHDRMEFPSMRPRRTICLNEYPVRHEPTYRGPVTVVDENGIKTVYSSLVDAARLTHTSRFSAMTSLKTGEPVAGKRFRAARASEIEKVTVG